MTRDRQLEGADRISIYGLSFSCIVGIRDRERKHRQPVSADIELEVDLRSAGRTDDIKKTVDYSGLADLIVREGEQSRYFLLEALAERIAELCLANAGVGGVTVAIWKRRRRKIYRKASIVLTRRK
jgi:FolB domain-containing protein